MNNLKKKKKKLQFCQPSTTFHATDFSLLKQAAQLHKHTCMATGKSFWASGGKKTSTAFLGNGWLPVGGVPTSMMCNYDEDKTFVTKPYERNPFSQLCF